MANAFAKKCPIHILKIMPNKNSHPKICPCCGYWKLKGEPRHSPTCKVAKWEAIKWHQAGGAKHQRNLQQQKKSAMMEDYLRKKRIGPPISVNSASKAKPHAHSNWPLIISAGAVESNKSRH